MKQWFHDNYMKLLFAGVIFFIFSVGVIYVQYKNEQEMNAEGDEYCYSTFGHIKDMGSYDLPKDYSVSMYKSYRPKLDEYGKDKFLTVKECMKINAFQDKVWEKRREMEKHAEKMEVFE